jgi:hypothetical protein
MAVEIQAITSTGPFMIQVSLVATIRAAEIEARIK